MQEENTGEIDFRRYWAVVVKRRYLAISVALAVLSIVTLGSFLWPRTYQASSTVFIERSTLIDPLVKDSGVSDSMEERLRFLKNALTSRNIIERVMKKLDLDAKAKNDAQYENTISDIIKNLKVNIDASRGRWSANLFEVSYRGRDPRAVKDIVNTLVGEYIEENVGYQRTQAAEAYDFVQAQLLEYRKKLDDSDSEIRAFKEKHPGAVTDAGASSAMKADVIESRIEDTKIGLKELSRKRENLQKQLAAEGPFLKEGFQARLNELNNQLIMLSARYTDDYPEIKKVKKEIEELKKQPVKAQPTGAPNPVYQQLRQDLIEADNEVEALRAKSEELAMQKRQAQGMLQNMPKAQEEWARLQRDRNIYQKMYDDLMQKLENAGASKDLELANKAGNFRVVDAAVLPTIPVKPNTVLMIALGIVLGISSGVATVLGLDHFTHSFKDENSIEEKFGLPVLATIPTVATEADRAASKRLDTRVFVAAGAYFILILLLLANEFLYRYLNVKTFNF